MESKDWYENRERFWKAEKINNPQNEEAWRNYYFASRYARMGTDEAERKKLLHSIFASDTYYKKYK